MKGHSESTATLGPALSLVKLTYLFLAFPRCVADAICRLVLMIITTMVEYMTAIDNNTITRTNIERTIVIAEMIENFPIKINETASVKISVA